MAVNAPEAGTIKEFLVNEEDTVTVGQDIVKIDTDGQSNGSAKPEEKPQSQPEPQSKPAPESKTEPKQDAGSSKPAPPAQPEKKEAKPVKDQSSKDTSSGSGLGSREERRVRNPDDVVFSRPSLDTDFARSK